MKVSMKNVINTTIGILFIVGLPILLIALFIYSLIPFYEDITRPRETRYIDYNDNQGVASFCDRNMSCLVNGKRIAVKEYWIEYLE